MKNEELVIFTRTYDLLTWLLPHTNHFPKVHRHTFTQRLLDAAFDLRERLEEGEPAAGRGAGAGARASARFRVRPPGAWETGRSVPSLRPLKRPEGRAPAAWDGLAAGPAQASFGFASSCRGQPPAMRGFAPHLVPSITSRFRRWPSP